MKITGTSLITGRGYAIFTDELWALKKAQGITADSKLKVTDGSRIVLLEIKSVEAALLDTRAQMLAFLVPLTTDEDTLKFIQGLKAELI